jgi:TPR repeat protein
MDDREAARLYKLAADQGDALAQVNLAVFYEIGSGGLQKDDREAARLYRLAADQGNALAQVSLAVFYETGRGSLPKNDREAARLYKLAADRGNAVGRPIWGSSMKRVAAACLWTIARPPDFSNSPRTREMCTRKLALSA